MKKCIQMLLLVLSLAVPVSAMDYYAPEAPASAEEWMPEQTESFSDGFIELLKKALAMLVPDIQLAAERCSGLFGIVILVSILSLQGGSVKSTAELAGTFGITTLLIQDTGSMIVLARNTIQELNTYGKMLLPVLTGALASQGGFSASTGLYIGTAFFSSLLGNLLTTLFIPLVYGYLALSVAAGVCGEEFLGRIGAMIKGGISWCLKTLLTVFTTYMSITRVVSGATDAATLKAAKVTISTVVPVVGGILSDASESILVGAGMMKNMAGIYGLFAVTALFLNPFMKIGAQYLVLKGSYLICGIFAPKSVSNLIADFSAAMGLLLALTSSMCLLILVSTVCFLKGAGA